MTVEVENHFESAKKVIANWPKWKQEYAVILEDKNQENENNTNKESYKAFKEYFQRKNNERDKTDKINSESNKR